jgi:hypothetical protein
MVFHLNLKKLMDVMTKEVFGATIYHMYTIEWQKRGLPHAHILLWLQKKLRPTNINHQISAEFPDPSNDPQLYDVIKSNMVHGPCGAVNPQSKCMEHGKCSKRYPRDLLAETQTGDDGYLCTDGEALKMAISLQQSNCATVQK